MLFGDDPNATPVAAAPSQPLDAQVASFLVANPSPGPAEVAAFIGPLTHDDRHAAVTALIAQGISAATIHAAFGMMHPLHRINWNMVRGIATLASAAAVAFHGARRNNSVGWGVAWFAFGAVAPIAASAVAVGQGFGRRKGA